MVRHALQHNAVPAEDRVMFLQCNAVHLEVAAPCHSNNVQLAVYVLHG